MSATKKLYELLMSHTDPRLECILNNTTNICKVCRIILHGTRNCRKVDRLDMNIDADSVVGHL